MTQKNIKIKQRDLSDCGAACLASVASHYKLHIPIARIRQYASTDEKGTNVLGLVEASEKLGFTTKGVKGTFEDLRQVPKPVIAHVVRKKILNHFVVIYEITKKHVLVMDPIFGEMVKQSHEEFTKEWTGVLLLMAPSDAFEKGDKTTSNLTRFWNLISPHKTVMFEALIGAAVTTVLGLSTAIYVQKIIDSVIVTGNRNLLNLMSVVMIAILLLRLFIGIVQSIFVVRTGQKMDVQLILGYYKHLMTLPKKFFDSMRIGEIISRMGDAAKIRTFINGIALNLIISVFTLFFGATLMLVYSTRLALLVFATAPLYALIYYVVNIINKKYLRKKMEQAADLESHLVESLNTIGTIKSFGLEWFSNIQMETRFVTLLETSYRSTIYSLFSGSATSFVSSITTILLLWLGADLVLDQVLTPGELMSCYTLVGYISGPLNSLITANSSIQDALIASDRLFEIIDLEREETEGNITLTPEMAGDIQFHDVSFRYGGRLSLFDKLNFTISKGKATAIIGESGSGKTTLASLIQKLYPLNGGHITISNNDTRYISNDSLRQTIGVVPQKIDVFSANVIQNIGCGILEPDMQKIKTICQSIGIDGVIEKLPHGYQTYLGENGVSLSGGEMQRIAIARALYKDPEILILDEATSSLDSTSERYIQSSIQSLVEKNKTVIIIAHRLSTIKNADHIIVLKEGKKAEEGTHDELLPQNGEYTRLWNNQFS